MKRVVVIGALLAVAAVALFLYWPFRSSKELRIAGIVEVQEVRLGSKVGGRVAELFVREGAQLHPGMKLLRLEAPELENQKKQLQAREVAAKADYDRALAGARAEEKRAAEAATAAAKARYDRIAFGWREEEKRWAVSELETASAELKQALDDYQRLYELYQSKSAAKADIDAALGARDRARGRVNAAKAKADMYQLGNRPEDVFEAKAEWEKLKAKADELNAGSRVEDIALAQAKWQEAKAKVEEVEISLKEATVFAPDSYEFKDAIVEIASVRVGDLVTANQPIFRVLCANDMWVKVFVPETELAYVKVGTSNSPASIVDVTLDGLPNKTFKGRVIQVSNVSEFTPRNVQSVDQRRFQVFGVRIAVDETDGRFHAGMATAVKLQKE
ncbi:MAG: efflux RND transporter periplasmic adaptor subunit [Gemmataceae bacterium]|nr:efflux RND transporter periplasmic adaptor subunit [Gemmataceae bacterium]